MPAARLSLSRGPAPMRRPLKAAPSAALATVLLAGCGGSPAATDTATTNTASTGANATGATGAAGAQNAGMRAFPGAAGQIAEISGSTLQVQSATAQTAVSYSSATTFTATVAGAAADLAVGKCISVRDAAAGAAADPTAAVPIAPTDPVTATSITITDALDGVCTGGPGGGPGGGLGGGMRGPGGRDGAAPDGATAPATGQADRSANPDRPGGFAGGRGVSGLITKISGNTITVEARTPGAPGGSQTGASASTPATRTVATTASTTFTKTVQASKSALEVGKCVTALGTADDTGAIAATSISVRAAQDGACSTGFGRPGANLATTAGAPAAGA